MKTSRNKHTLIIWNRPNWSMLKQKKADSEFIHILVWNWQMDECWDISISISIYTYISHSNGKIWNIHHLHIPFYGGNDENCVTQSIQYLFKDSSLHPSITFLNLIYQLKKSHTKLAICQLSIRLTEEIHIFHRS